jgi:zinc-ribbon domain
VICAKCGRDLPEGAAFCMHCGAPVSLSQQSGTDAGSGIDEIGLFAGKNAGYYMTIFRKFNIRGVETFAPTWNWAAFLFNFWWMLYRKLYLWALLWLLLTLIPVFGFAFWIAAGITGNYLYYRHATSKIREAKSMQPPDRLPAVLAELGGVNGWVIPVGIVVMTGFLLLAILFGIGMGIFCTFAGKGVGI